MSDPPSNIDRAWIMSELRRAIQALAAPGAVALALFPDDAAKADELAIDFAHFREVACGNFPHEFGPQQTAALERIDRLLEAMSGWANKELWTDAAVCTSPRWREVRDHANAALRLAPWPWDPA